MKKFTLLFMMVCTISVAAQAQQSTLTPEQEVSYTRTINQRADKIVVTLGLPDEAKVSRVRTIIASQYRNLNEIYTARDRKLKEAGQKTAENKDSLSVLSKKLEQDVTASLDKLHASYIAALSTELNADQVVKVKDGMTYGVLPITYNGYQQMLPDLTNEQKQQIMTWLVEAREHAMDAESSEKKHWWFGKYKGRINNYLASVGYDLKKAGQDWEKRRNAEKTAVSDKK